MAYLKFAGQKGPRTKNAAVRTFLVQEPLLDGEAVFLGVDGITPPSTTKVFDLLATDGDNLRDLPLSMRNASGNGADDGGVRLIEYGQKCAEPFDRDLELAGIETGTIHPILFPCRRDRPSAR
jgi:hypothetical protein